MLKLPKGLKKKKKGKKSKRKDDELFTEEELEKYRKEHQQQEATTSEQQGEKHNEEWDKFKDLTSGIDSVLRKTQGDLDRIKSTSFFQRRPGGVREVNSVGREVPARPAPPPPRPVVEVTEADFPGLARDRDHESDLSDRSDEEDEEDDSIFDTSYVEAVEKGEVKLAYVPDSPELEPDDDIFDTSHVDVLIQGEAASKQEKSRRGVELGVAVSVLTGRIDAVKLPTSRRRRPVPGDLIAAEPDAALAPPPEPEPVEKSILDVDEDIPISTPIDLSVSLHTEFLQKNKKEENAEVGETELETANGDTFPQEEEDDEFTLLAAESLEVKQQVIRLEDNEIKLEPVLQESWSVFDADKCDTVFAEGIVEDQIDVIDPYLDQEDPFDTSFADAVVPSLQTKQFNKPVPILEDDDDFDPRADEVKDKLNNRRKSSVRIHLTDPSGIRESITSDDQEKQETKAPDLLSGSHTDLTQLPDCPLDPLDINNVEFDPFDTSAIDDIVAPGKTELKLLEKELINQPLPRPIYRVPSDPDFDPRADEKVVKEERRASRPENLIVNKSVVFNVDGSDGIDADSKTKQPKPVTPYYTREVSITEDNNEEAEDTVSDSLTRTRSDEDLSQKFVFQAKRRHSEYSSSGNVKPPLKTSNLLESAQDPVQDKVLTPAGPGPTSAVDASQHQDPFDTSFASNITPSKIELKLLAKEFSCEETHPEREPDIFEPSEEDIFQPKALSPQPTRLLSQTDDDFDPFDTSFASDLQPGRTELKLLESEFLK